MTKKRKKSNPPDGEDVSPVLPGNNTRYVQILVGLTLVGLVLRFYNLGFNSLWLDEATTVSWSKGGFFEIWKIAFSSDFHPPLFHWIEHCMMIFGQSEFVLRTAPAIFGVLTIPVFYGIGKEIYDKNVGIISAALLTVSYFGIYYSQEAYSYSMVLFVFSIVILLYLIALRTNSITHWIFFGITSAVAFWTHYYVFIGLSVIYLHVILTKRDDLKKNVYEAKNILAALGITVALTFPLLLIVGGRFFALTGSPPTYGVLGPILVQETFIRFSGGYSSFGLIITILYLILISIGLGFLYIKDKTKGIFSAMFLILPIIASVLVSSKMTMNPRYLIYILPVFFTLVAMSYPVLLRLVPHRNLLYVVIVLIGVMSAPVLNEYYSGYTKEDWRGLSGIIQSKTAPGDIVVLVPGYVSVPFDYYYSNATDNTIEYGASSGKALADISGMRKNNTVFYIVTGDISAANPKGDAVTWLSQNTRRDSEHTGIYILSSFPGAQKN